MHNGHIGQLASSERASRFRGAANRSGPGFQHELLVHSGDDGFLAGTLKFLGEGVAAEEPMLVAVSEQRIAALRGALGADARRIEFADMRVIGANPARIIPVWQRFLEQHADSARPLRGIGEPVWGGRTPAELSECERHESRLDGAFEDAPAFRLLCPYDLETLDPDVIHAAARNHPHVAGRPAGANRDYVPPGDPFAGTLPVPAAAPRELAFSVENLPAVRRLVAEAAASAALEPARTEDLVLAVSELAANSICHGGGTGTLRVWVEDRVLLSEVSDHGHIEDPLAGLRTPNPEQLRGRGLWLVNQVCDLAQIRSSPDAATTTVRLHMRLP